MGNIVDAGQYENCAYVPVQLDADLLSKLYEVIVFMEQER